LEFGERKVQTGMGDKGAKNVAPVSGNIREASLFACFLLLARIKHGHNG
jgi:hypothetical protein